MSRKTLIICDLCGKEIQNVREAERYKILRERWSPTIEDFQNENIDAHESCVRSLMQAKYGKMNEVPNGER